MSKTTSRFRAVYGILSLPCSEASRLISRSMDGSLPWSERLALRLHLVVCRLCRRYRGQLFWMRRMLSRYSERLAEVSAPKPPLSDPARARMKTALREVSGGASESEDPAP